MARQTLNRNLYVACACPSQHHVDKSVSLAALEEHPQPSRVSAGGRTPDHEGMHAGVKPSEHLVRYSLPLVCYAHWLIYFRIKILSGD